MRRRVCFQALRSTNPLSTSKCLERPSYAAAYLDIARRAFSNSRPIPPSSQSSVVHRLKNKDISFKCCSTSAKSIKSISIADAWGKRGVSTHTIAQAPLDRRKSASHLNYICWRSIHSGKKTSLKTVLGRDNNSSADKEATKLGEEKLQDAPTTPEHLQEARTAPDSPAPPPESKPSDVPKDETSGYLHMPQMPKMPHRPTREEVLAAATGFWSGLKLRFKWFSIRSARPWNADDYSAFASWFFLGHIVWVFVGTTTFFSIIIFTINTVVAQGNCFQIQYQNFLLTYT